MPVMPRPKKAKAIADKVMKKSAEEVRPKEKKVNGESKFDRDIRTMIKR